MTKKTDQDEDLYIEFDEFLYKEYKATVKDVLENDENQLCVIVKNEYGFEEVVLPDKYQSIDL